jgi:hypothetical protein
VKENNGRRVSGRRESVRACFGWSEFFAAEGSVPRGFTGPMLKAAWKHKK